VKRFVVAAMLVSAAVAASATGCFVPSVPVPPPDPAGMSFALTAEQGTATYQANLGVNWPNTKVIVFDEQTGEGVVATSDGTGRVGPTQPFRANDGDTVQIEFRRDDGEEAGVCLILHDGPSNSNNECGF
jgi:hypothetical protein